MSKFPLQLNLARGGAGLCESTADGHAGSSVSVERACVLLLASYKFSLRARLALSRSSAEHARATREARRALLMNSSAIVPDVCSTNAAVSSLAAAAATVSLLETPPGRCTADAFFLPPFGSLHCGALNYDAPERRLSVSWRWAR